MCSTLQRQYSCYNTPLGHHTDRGPMSLGLDRLEEYCDPHTASSVILILIYQPICWEVVKPNKPYIGVLSLIQSDPMMADMTCTDTADRTAEVN